MSEILQILNHYSPDCQPTRVEPLGAAGGMSGAQFWRASTHRGGLVLRRWPTEHPTAERLRFIHTVLEHAARRGVTFVPVPIRATTGETFVRWGGHLWELAPWMPGTADYDRAPSAEKLQASVRALAQFHIAVADFDRKVTAQSDTRFTAISRRLKMLRELQTGGAHQLTHAITDGIWPDLAPLARQFTATLPDAIARVVAQLSPLVDLRFALQPCLRDVWHDHILFSGDEVTGVVDFGAMDIDTPAGDVARLLGSLAGDDSVSWQTGVVAYDAVRPLSTDESRAVPALDASGIVLAGCNWIRWIYIDGRQFENHAQVIERFRRLVVRCSQPRSGDIVAMPPLRGCVESGH